MARLTCAVIIATLASLLVAGQAPERVDPPKSRTPSLLATQVTVGVDRNGARRRFRATVVRVEGDVVTVLTAAHCIAEADKGWPVAFLFAGGLVVEGVVDEVARNPRYRPNQPREIPGPDNAVARLRFQMGAEAPARQRDDASGLGTANTPRVIPTSDPAAIQAFRSIQPVPALANKFYPGPSGEAVDVRMIDGRGIEHAVRAGNFSNPRWLEWGRAYQPVPGDSGGGVFVIRPGPTGQPRPILIGIIVGRDDRGGGASLVTLGESWVVAAMQPPGSGS